MRHSEGMVALAPSLLSASFATLGETVAAFEKAERAARPDLLHFDLMDGHFVPNLTFGTKVMQDLRGLTSVPFDTHLMVENPERYIEACAAAKVERVTIHAEATRHLPRLLAQIRDEGMLAGVALNPATSLESLRWVKEDLQFLLVMGVNPGFGGQAFLPQTIEKVAAAREMLPQTCVIGVDGGVGTDNAAELVRAGAAMLVAGSSLFDGGEPLEALQTLRKAVKFTES